MMTISVDTAAVGLLCAAERQVMSRGWSCVWPDGETIEAMCSGVWSDYRMIVRWRAGVLSVDCRFAVAPPFERVTEIERLHSDLVPRLGAGALALELEEGRALFSQSARVTDDAPGLRRASALVQAAVETCDMFYPAFLLVAWADASADAALQSTGWTTLGRA